MRIDLNTKRPLLANRTGGLSGPAVGKALEDLLEKAVDGVLPNNREALLEHVRKNREPGGEGGGYERP